MLKDDFIILMNLIEEEETRLEPLADMLDAFSGNSESIYVFVGGIVDYIERDMETDLVVYYLYEGWKDFIGDAEDLYDLIINNYGKDPDTVFEENYA